MIFSFSDREAGSIEGKRRVEQTMVSYDALGEYFFNKGSRLRLWSDIVPLLGCIRPGNTVLDLGCGNGEGIPYLPPRVQYWGIDTNEKLIRILQERYEGDSSKHFLVGDMEDAGLYGALRKDLGTADVIMSIATLHHILSVRGLEKALNECSTLLASEGRMVVSFWNMWNVSARKSIWNMVRKGGVRGILRALAGERDLPLRFGNASTENVLWYRAYTVKEIRDTALSAGFVVESLLYSKEGTPAHWWDGNNIVGVLRKK